MKEAEHVSGPRSCDLTEISRAAYVGEIPSSVAGWYFHRAPAFPGECVSLVREPANPYDAHAIAVLNAHGQRIGYVPRQQSATLAPYIDSRVISVTGRLVHPGESGYDEHLAQTRPPLTILVFTNPADGSTIPAGTAVTPGLPHAMLDRPAYDSTPPEETEIPF
jgi:hypothetical protein